MSDASENDEKKKKVLRFCFKGEIASMKFSEKFYAASASVGWIKGGKKEENSREVYIVNVDDVSIRCGGY